MRKVLGIVCRQKEYMYRLADALGRAQFREWEIACFESTAEFFSWNGSCAAGALLIEEACQEEWYQQDRAREENVLCVWLTEDNTGKNDSDTEPCIFMFQSADRVGEQLLQFVTEKMLENRSGPRERQLAGKPPPGPEEKAPGERAGSCGIDSAAEHAPVVLGFCSPCGGVGTTSLAYGCAKELARKNEVLFLSLDPFPGLAEGLPNRQGISELLYLLSEYDGDWVEHKVTALIRQNRMDMILGIADFRDLYELDCDVWNHLISGLRKEQNYQYVLVDFGKICSFSGDLLKSCQSLAVIGESASPKMMLWHHKWEKSGMSSEPVIIPPRDVGTWEKDKVWEILQKMGV